MSGSTTNATRPVVVYDGECRFCLRQTERLQRRDPRNLFEYVPRQTEGIEQRFPKLAEGDFNTGMRLVHPDGRVSVGADAIYQISRRLWPYKLAAWLYLVPGLRWVFRRAYAWIAANRYRLAGKCETGACSVSKD